jgi:hypothetical protein
MPADYEPWGRVYDLFHCWQRIFTELQARADAKVLITWDLNIDSIVYRVHQHATRKVDPQKEPARRCRQSSPTTTASGARAAA